MTVQANQSISIEDLREALRCAESVVKLLARYPETPGNNFHIRVLLSIMDQKHDDVLIAERSGNDLFPCVVCEQKMTPGGSICDRCWTEEVRPVIDDLVKDCGLKGASGDYFREK
jgi:hypothetical protein